MTRFYANVTSVALPIYFPARQTTPTSQLAITSTERLLCWRRWSDLVLFTVFADQHIAVGSKRSANWNEKFTIAAGHLSVYGLWHGTPARWDIEQRWWWWRWRIKAVQILDTDCWWNHRYERLITHSFLLMLSIHQPVRTYLYSAVCRWQIRDEYGGGYISRAVSFSYVCRTYISFFSKLAEKY